MHTPSLFPELGPTPPARTARLAFDIEIADVIELAPGDDLARHGPFAIAVAAIATDREEVRHWFEPGNDGRPARSLSPARAKEMLEFLRAAQHGGVSVCAWNGLAFDLRGLAGAAGAERLAAEIALDLIDPMFQFFVQRGFPIGLAAVAEGFGLSEKKLMHAADAPKEWAAGNHQRVLDYVAGDCRLTQAVTARIEQDKRLVWRTKKGTLASEPCASLIPVRELLRRRLPDTSWMDKPLARASYYAWLEPHVEFEATA
jgi:hypothetical protein